MTPRATIVGVCFCLAERLTHLRRDSYQREGTKIYCLYGPLFFGSVRSFHDQFNPSKDPEEVVINFSGSRVCNHSGLKAVSSFTERYQGQGKKLRLKHLSAECRSTSSREDALHSD